MTFAFNQMRRIAPNNRLYQYARESISKAISEIGSGRVMSDEQKNHLSVLFSGTDVYYDCNKNTRRFKIGEEPGGWIRIDRTGRCQPDSQKIKVSDANKGRKIYHHKITNEVVFQKEHPGEDWNVGQTDDFKDTMSNIHFNNHWYYNIETHEQIRSKEPPGDKWIRKRVHTGKFQGFEDINKKKKYLNLITKEIEMSDEKMPWHINHPGRKLSDVVFIKKDDLVFCNAGSLDFPFKTRYNIDALSSYVVPNPHHNMTENNRQFCKMYRGMTLHDIGYEVLSLRNFVYSNNCKIQE